MLRKFVCTAVVFALVVAVTKAEDIRVFIFKVDTEKSTITYKLNKKGEATGDEVTAKLADKAVFVKGKRDPDDKKKIIDGDAIPEGIKADIFAKIPDKGISALLTTNDDKAITKVVVLPGKKKE